MESRENPTPETEMSRSNPTRNPYIMNFCKVLVEKKGEKTTPEALEELLENMYHLFERMLGQNLVNALPENLRKEYLGMADDLQKLSYEKIGEVFANVPHYDQIMKETMKQFAEIFMKNREFRPEDYPVPQNPA